MGGGRWWFEGKQGRDLPTRATLFDDTVRGGAAEHAKRCN